MRSSMSWICFNVHQYKTESNPLVRLSLCTAWNALNLSSSASLASVLWASSSSSMLSKSGSPSTCARVTTSALGFIVGAFASIGTGGGFSKSAGSCLRVNWHVSKEGWSRAGAGEGAAVRGVTVRDHKPSPQHPCNSGGLVGENLSNRPLELSGDSRATSLLSWILVGLCSLAIEAAVTSSVVRDGDIVSAEHLCWSSAIEAAEMAGLPAVQAGAQCGSSPNRLEPAPCARSANRYISAARANYRKLPLGRLLLMALPGCMPSLGQHGQPGAEIRVLRHQRHSTGISAIGRLTHP